MRLLRWGFSWRFGRSNNKEPICKSEKTDVHLHGDGQRSKASETYGCIVVTSVTLCVIVDLMDADTHKHLLRTKEKENTPTGTCNSMQRRWRQLVCLLLVLRDEIIEPRAVEEAEDNSGFSNAGCLQGVRMSLLERAANTSSLSAPAFPFTTCSLFL